MEKENKEIHQIILDKNNPDKIQELLLKSLREYNYDLIGKSELTRFAIYIWNFKLKIF